MDSQDSERSDEVAHKDSGHSVKNVSGNSENSEKTQGAEALAAKTINDQLSQEWLHRVKEAQRIYVKTTGYEHVWHTLDYFGHALVTGSPGSGKTTMTFRIMGKYLKKKYKVKFYESASDFKPKHISQHFPTLLVFDDIFGYFSPTTTELVQCRKVFDYLKTRFKHLEEKRRGRPEEEEGSTAGELPFRVLMNSRTNVWEMVKRNFLEFKMSLFRESAIADLTTLTKLSDEEKEKILMKHLSVRKCVTLSSDDIKTITSLDYSSLGFPHLCELFVDSDCPKDKIFEFFQKPMMYLVGMIEKIFYQSEERACVLLLMILNDGVLGLFDLQVPKDREACGLNIKLALCGEIIHNVPIPSKISKTAQQEKNSLLISVEDTIKFSHPTIHDAVAFVVGSENPVFVLQHCSLQFITERTEIIEKTASQSGGDYNNFKIILTADAGRYLLKRLAEEIVNGDYALSLSHQCLMSQVLVDNLFEQLSKEDETHTYLHALDNKYNKGFLFWSSFICMGPVTERCFKLTEFNCHEILEGCFGCCMSGNTRSFQALVSNSPSSHDAIVSSTLASILENQSETRSLYRSLSSASPTKPNTPDEKETVRMHGNNRDMLIHIAAANGFDTIVKILLDLGCHIDAVGGNEMTALMYACYLGHVELVKILVSLGADPLLLDEEGDNCLHLACRGGSKDSVQYLLAKNMDVNERGEHDRTPLMYAADNGHEEIVRFLLQKGAIPEPALELVKNKDNALHLACAKGHTAIVIMLLEEGQMDVEVQDGKTRTPIMYACRYGHLETAQVLYGRGTKLDISDDMNLPCVHLASVCGSVETVEWILSVLGQKAMDSVSSKGRTPLMMAFQYGQSNMIEFLLHKGANFDHTDDENEQCIHSAAKSGILSLIDMCITKGQELNAVSSTGLTPVKLACRNGHLDLVKYLVQKGANVRDDSDGGCLHNAVVGGHLDIVEYIVDTFLHPAINEPGLHAMTPFMIACKFAFIDIFNFLLSRGADVTCRDDFNRSCLHVACRGGSLEIVKKLMTLKFDIEEEDVNGMTPLAHAVKCDNVEVIEYLVQEGADVQKTVSGRSYLHSAARSGSTKSCKKLLDFGINVDVTDNHDKTPLMYAAENGHEEIVRFLLQKGAIPESDPTLVKNKDNALHLACAKGHTAIVRMLLEEGRTNIEVQGEKKRTPIIYACRHGHLKTAQELKERGANLVISDDMSLTCLHLASMCGNVGTAEWIINILGEWTMDSVCSKGRTPLMMAFQYGQSNMIEFLLQKGANFDHTDDENAQCIHFAVKSGICSLVDLCLTKGQELNAVSATGLTPVKLACRHGHLDLVKYLVLKGAHVRDDSNGGCLHNAVVGRHLDIVEYIVDTFLHPAINEPGLHAMTPLMITCKFAFIDIFNFLLSRGADVTCRDDFNLSCLHVACRGGSLEIVKKLMTQKFDIEEEDVNGMTPLAHAVKCDNVEVIEYLVQEGADVHRTLVSGRSYLHKAAWNGSTKSCQKLLDLGINVDTIDSCDRTPLMSAVGSKHDNSDVIKLLLANGSDIKHTARNMNTCLHDGSFNGHQAQIRLVLDLGLNPNLQGSLSQTPLFSACRGGNREVFDLLLQRGADFRVINSKRASCLHAIASSKSPDIYIANQLLNMGLDINALDDTNKTPVMYAVFKRNESFVDFLLSKGSSLSTLDQRWAKSTLLHFACSMKDIATEIPGMLIKHGIDIDADDDRNKTPVMCAVNKNNLGLVRFLLSKGCSLNTYIRRGVPNTLLHYACSMNNVGTEIIDVLVSYGISLNARNSYHQTPIMCAARQGNQTLVEYLRSLGADMWLVDE